MERLRVATPVRGREGAGELMKVDEGTKRRELRKVKVVATGFLAFATVVYLICRWQESRGAGGWVGYVRAASEAGMVGADDDHARIAFMDAGADGFDCGVPVGGRQLVELVDQHQGRRGIADGRQL